MWKKGSELEKDDKGRYYKGRYVYQGNRVKDQNSNAALFNEIGSSPAGMESSKAMDAYGLLPGHSIQQADAAQAYTQALMGDSINGGVLSSEGFYLDQTAAGVQA